MPKQRMPTLFKIFVTHVVDPLNLWAHIGNDDSLQQFSEFEQSLNDHVQRVYNPSDKAACPDMDTLQQKQLNRQLVLVCCPQENKTLRAIITNISWDPEEVDVFYCDYGYTEFVPKEAVIVDIPEYATLWPNQAWRCGLDGIRPIANTWVSRAIKRFGELVLHQILNAHVLGVSDTGMVTVDILIDDPELVRSVTDILIEEGCGMTMQSSSPEPTKSEIPDFNIMTLQKQISDDRKSDGSSIDFEIDAFTRGVQRSDSSGTVGYEGSDMKLGTGNYPSSRNVFINIQDQIDHCKAVHAKMTQDLTPIFEQSVKPEVPSRKKGGRGSGRNTPVDLKDNVSPSLGRRNRQGKSYRADSGNVPPRFQREGSRGRGIRKTSADREPKAVSGPMDPHSALDTDWGFVPANSKKDSSGSPSHSNTSDSSTKLATVASEPPPIQRPTVNIPMTEQLKNEYEWQADQFKHRVDQILTKATEENLNQTVEEVSQLVKPDKSKFTDLPGPGELYLLTESLINHAVVKGETRYSIVLKIMDVFQTDGEFPDLISGLLWKTQARFVKVSSSRREEELAESYCKFIARLYISAMDWVDSGSVNVFALNTIEKWAVFNKGGQHPDPQNILDLYAGCLTTFLQEAGPKLIDFLPTEMELLFTEVRQRVLSSDVPRSAREKLLNLLLVVETSFNQTTSFHTLTPNTSTDRQVPSAVAQPPTEPPTFPRNMNVSTQTFTTEFADKGAQTHLLGSTIVALEQSKAQPGPRKPIPADPYLKVKTMLEDLQLTELYQTFKTNAIRDSVLNSEYDDLKALLRECGVLPGQVLEIKLYLSKQVSEGEKLDTVSGACEQATSSALGKRSVALISPQDFERSDSTKISDLQSRGQTDHEVVDTIDTKTAQNLNKAGQVGPYMNQNGLKAHSADDSHSLTGVGYNTRPPGVKVSSHRTVTPDSHSHKAHHHEKMSDFLVHSFRHVDASHQPAPSTAAQPSMLRPHQVTAGVQRPSPEMQQAKESLVSYTALNDFSRSPHKPQQAESQLELKESSSADRSDPRHPCNKYPLSKSSDFVKGFMTLDGGKKAEQMERQGSGDHTQSQTKPQSNTDNLPVLKTTLPHYYDNDDEDEDGLDSYYEGQEDDIVVEQRSVPKLSLGDPSLGQGGTPIDAMTRRPTAEDNRKSIARNFGRRKVRYCTACGSDSHIIDDCPEKTRKLFFN